MLKVSLVWKQDGNVVPNILPITVWDNFVRHVKKEYGRITEETLVAGAKKYGGTIVIHSTNPHILFENEEEFIKFVLIWS